MHRRVLPLMLALTAVAAVLASSATGAKQDVTLNLVAYSTPRPVIVVRALAPAFEEYIVEPPEALT